MRSLGLTFLLLAAAISAPADPPSVDDGTTREAIQGYVARGAPAIPELRAMLERADPAARRIARVALGRITGQWGNDGAGLRWKRTLDEAVGHGKPILVLQLFGKFDEEFC